MNKERKNIGIPAILKGLRAITGLEQSEAAKLAKLSTRTIIFAESGKEGARPVHANTIGKLLALYESLGVKLAYIPGQQGEPVPIIAFDQDIAPKAWPTKQ